MKKLLFFIMGIILPILTTYAQYVPIIISGKIRSSDTKQALEAITIYALGSKSSATSDKAGSFNISISKLPDTLVISHVGYQSKQVPVNSTINKLTIDLDIDTKELEEITISSGYERISKERMVGSFSQIDSATYARRAGMGILERLDGYTTGILFTKKGGQAPLQVRGISSIYGHTDQLIVVDNFPYSGDLGNINPNDVRDITILKDAAAASIWGAKAGNGVIVITTKQGSYNQPVRVSLSSNVSLQEKPDLFYYPGMPVNEIIEIERFLYDKGYYQSDLANNTDWPVISPVIEALNDRDNNRITPEEAENRLTMLKNRDVRYDLEKYVYQPVFRHQQYLTLTGGNSRMNAALSAGFNATEKNIQHSKQRTQYTLNGNFAFRPVKGIELTAGLNYGFTKTPTAGVVTLPGFPYSRLVDEAGNPASVERQYRERYLDTAGAGRLLDWKYRPLDELSLVDKVTQTRLTRISLGTSFEPLPWLKAELKYQYQAESSALRDHSAPATYFVRNLVNRYSQPVGETLNRIIPEGGILDLGNNLTTSSNYRAQLSINKSWNNKHLLTGLIAGEVNENELETSTSRLYGYNEDIGTYAAFLDYKTNYRQYGRNQYSAIPQNNTYTDGRINRGVSVLGNLNYSYLNRYNLYISARKDGSNVFGVNTNNKWKPLWSAGAGWDISKENFYKIEAIPYLRLRGSFGYMGNTNYGSGIPTIRYDPVPDLYTGLYFAQVGNAPNPDLRWEEVQTTNMGLDFRLLKNRVSGSLDVYWKKSTDLISPIPFDITTGVSEYTVNSASLKGNGLELTLASQNILHPIRWETNFGLSYARSIVTDIYNGDFTASDFIGYDLHPSPGKLAFGIVSYKWTGLDPLTGDPQGYFNKELSKNYTSIFSDSVDNQVFHGSSIPLLFGYVNNRFNWKSISLSVSIAYRLNYYYRQTALSYSSLFRNLRGHAEYSRRWKQPGDEALTQVPSLMYPANNNRDQFYQNAETHVHRGDNVRLSEIRLGYSLNSHTFHRLPMQRIEFFIFANNLNIMLWKADKSIADPDNDNQDGILSFPPQRVWTAGLSIQF